MQSIGRNCGLSPATADYRLDDCRSSLRQRNHRDSISLGRCIVLSLRKVRLENISMPLSRHSLLLPQMKRQRPIPSRHLKWMDHCSIRHFSLQ